MAEFDNVAPCRVELRNDAFQAGARVVEARGKLKQETSHARAEEIRDVAEVADQRLRPRESFDVRNEFRCFDGVNERAPTRLTLPAANGRHGRP